MRLPNFLKSERMNALKTQMGRSADRYGGFQVDPTRLTSDEREALESGDGIEVSFNQLTILSDGTLAFKDSRVLLYIRDVHLHDDRVADKYPRYHVYNCRTLRHMTAIGHDHRYVISAETNGEFALNLIANGRPRSERHRLLVCQNCLDALSFDEFSLQDARTRRERYVREFIPAKFFTIYPRSLHTVRPRYSSNDAPIDNYTSDFSAISRRVREQANWCCDQCRRSFERRDMQQYLHTHHVNGERRNNSPGNLRPLCIVCHAEQPMHGHLKRDPRYDECKRLLGLARAFAP